MMNKRHVTRYVYVLFHQGERVHIWLAEIVGLERYAFEQLQCEQVIVYSEDQIPIIAKCRDHFVISTRHTGFLV